MASARWHHFPPSPFPSPLAVCSSVRRPHHPAEPPSPTPSPTSADPVAPPCPPKSFAQANHHRLLPQEQGLMLPHALSWSLQGLHPAHYCLEWSRIPPSRAPLFWGSQCHSQAPSHPPLASALPAWHHPCTTSTALVPGGLISGPCQPPQHLPTGRSGVGWGGCSQ